jgi:hypothetical protein
MWLAVWRRNVVQGGSFGLLLFTGFLIISDITQVAPGHYIMSRDFKPIQDAVYWDIEYPNKVSWSCLLRHLTPVTK